ncbi:hypothetical protein DWB61_05625 [Ancylomarina euxinus]|uniref:Uncharacterized protein n=1 Tax=Ancylomarina euxinus TaxID=2283627 RepID=A0A425Y3T2_9BACT|nr:hypothetical protein [Ancylomarina euxinus]MCZ4694515.1 hypothetical protein [Ancylomarina euxinus]MUP14058.1 hypothetical protein [Ancylomarina euxinus]RRG22919.1 hypothetical protein DWB61_05625 [Ancylomarina euxinus]
MEIHEIISPLVILFIIAIFIVIKPKKDIREPAVENKIKLLPYWFKYIGMIVAVIGFVLNFVVDINYPNIEREYLIFTMVFGLLIFALSSEKSEDELLKQIRANSIFSAFFIGILIHLILLFLNHWIGGPIKEYSSIYVIGWMLGVYIGTFYSAKKRLKTLNSMDY